MYGEPRSFGARGGPTVRTVSTIAFPSSRPPRPVGSQHPFRWGLSTRQGWPYPSDDRRAFACSHSPDPLGLGPPCGRWSRLDRPPMGLTVFHQLERPTPSGHPLPRWASILSMGRRQRCPSCPHTMLVRASPPFWPVRLHEVCGCSPCDPIALFLSPGVRVRLPGPGTFLHASHLPVTRDARFR
jgi:hypothetical protein